MTTHTAEHVNYDQVEWDAERELVVAHVSNTTAGTITAATFSVPEADRPARDVALEVPAQGSTLSGMCSVDDFPGAEHSVTVEWDEPQQSFLVTRYAKALHDAVSPFDFRRAAPYALRHGSGQAQD